MKMCPLGWRSFVGGVGDGALLTPSHRFPLQAGGTDGGGARFPVQAGGTENALRTGNSRLGQCGSLYAVGANRWGGAVPSTQ